MTTDQTLPVILDMNFKMIKVGTKYAAIVSPEDYDRLSLFTWFPHKSHRSIYARTTFYAHGVRITKSMHRMVANTPPHMVPHHINRRTLDNRRLNLINMVKKDHTLLHRNDTLHIVYTAP